MDEGNIIPERGKQMTEHGIFNPLEVWIITLNYITILTRDM